MSNYNPITNFIGTDAVDLGKKLITKDYLLDVYPSLVQELGITPELWTWGFNDNMQLGNATTVNTSTPVTTFSGGTNWKQVSMGYRFCAGIKTDGTLWTWGSGSYGRLGNGATTGIISTPVTTFAGGTNWKQVDCTHFHAAAVKTDGTLWAWGSNTNGQLGNATLTATSTPVTTFAGGTNWKQVSTSNGRNTAAVKTDGTLWLWGRGDSGRLGNATTDNTSTPVTTFAGGTNWKTVALSRESNAAIKTDGTLWLWGFAGNGLLGNGVITGSVSTPVTTFAGGTNWKQVDGGYVGDAFAAVKTDGTLWLWGSASTGILGNGATTGFISTPVTTFSGGNNWKQVSVGRSYVAAIKTDGTLWTWGNSAQGQLGNASLLDRSTPVTTFLGGNNWKQVYAGNGGPSTAAIKSSDFI